MPKFDSGMDFDQEIKVRQKAFKYRDQYYVMQEASEGAAVAYRNNLMACAKGLDPNTGKPTSVSGLASVEPLLVADCTFIGKMSDNGEDVEITSEKIKVENVHTWPSRVVASLYKWVHENSDLAEDSPEQRREALLKELEKLDKVISENKSKNLPKPTTSTSS